MSEPFREFRFRWPWRPYQQRVLDAAERHAADRRIHIVAAPGAGKTVLGLEMVRRFGAPALVLSPTLTIRDQWLARLVDFSPDSTNSAVPEWASTDLDELRPLTSVTYQSLLTRHRRDQLYEQEIEDETQLDALAAPEIRALADRLAAAGVETLVLDEAHHLRQEWWKALVSLVEALPDPHLISLTGTPPYDVHRGEWQRYEQLCGAIDEEISIPELVRSGTLCPHQDYIFAVVPSQREVAKLRDAHSDVETLLEDLASDMLLRERILAHPWLHSPVLPEEAILDDPEFAVALLSYQKAVGDSPRQTLLDLLDLEAIHLPALDRRWWSTLLEHYLFDPSWPDAEEEDPMRKRLARRMRDTGLLWRRTVRITEPSASRTLLSQSASKIPGCIEICSLERQLRGEQLRQAILTDFIRDDPREHTVRLGAWPIFRALFDSEVNAGRTDLALVTGRLVVIHETVANSLRTQTDVEQPTTRPIPDLEGYMQITSPSASRLVGALTQRFESGEIRVLVGTHALLGEGWDAPALNSLVLASYVGTFMLTNQMRGRALRTSRLDPEKQASIWHLAAVDTTVHGGLRDFESLRERFETFVGLTAGGALIESGLDRLALPRPTAPEWHARLNAEMTERLAATSDLALRWREALEGSSSGQVVPSVDVKGPPPLRRAITITTLKHLLYLTVSAFTSAASMLLANSPRTDSEWRSVLFVLALAAAGGTAAALPHAIRSARLLFRALPVDGSLHQMGEALLEALVRGGQIETDPKKLAVRSRELPDSQVTIRLQGGTFYETSLFADAFAEMLAPIENPRYLLTREAKFLWALRRDYHAVPALLGSRKELVEPLHEAWTRRLGESPLVYTRTGEGRRILLRARARAFSGLLAASAQRIDRWT